MYAIDHPTAGYRFLTGIAPYSAAVAAQPGHALVRAHFARPPELWDGFARIAAHLEGVDRPKAALCSMELRIPAPLSFEEFAQFNATYQQQLREWDLLVDGLNPIARTNVAPIQGEVTVPALHAFTYTVPRARAEEADSPNFVIAGAGELQDQADLRPEAIVRAGESGESALMEKAFAVMAVMHARLDGLDLTWEQVEVIDLYTPHAPTVYFQAAVAPQLGPAALHGVHWYPSHPPIAGLAYEMDLRTVWQDHRLT